jgi:hypothetical protein
MPVLSSEELISRLPNKEFWFTSEIATAFEVDRRTIQYAAARKGIGMKVRQGPRGTYVFQPHDLEKLCEHIHAEVGNPNMIAKRKIKKDTFISMAAEIVLKEDEERKLVA